jgi:hypothetical protein
MLRAFFAALGPNGQYSVNTSPFFKMDFGTKAAILKTVSGCHWQLVNKIEILVTRLWLGSRRIKRKEK